MISVDDLIKQLEPFRGGKLEKITLYLYGGAEIQVDAEDISVSVDKAWCDCEKDREKDITIIIK